MEGWGGGGGVSQTLSFPEGASALVRIGEWAESNQVFLQAGPSVLLGQDRGQGRGCDHSESDSVIGQEGQTRQRERPLQRLLKLSRGPARVPWTGLLALLRAWHCPPDLLASSCCSLLALLVEKPVLFLPG